MNYKNDIFNEKEDLVIKDLAFKSKAGTVSAWVVEVALFLLGVINLIVSENMSNKDSKYYIMGLVLIIFSIINFPFTIRTVSTPMVPIKYNDLGLFLYFGSDEDGEFIPYDAIEKVKDKHSRSRRHTYSYGKIIILTKNNEYVMRNIENIDEIKDKIIELKTIAIMKLKNKHFN